MRISLGPVSDAFENLPLVKKGRLLIARNRAYRSVFDGRDGRLVLADILRFCEDDTDAHAPGMPDQTAYVLGKQRVAKRIKSVMRMSDEETYALLEQTHGEEVDHADED